MLKLNVNKILAPTDFSGQADETLRYTLDIAEPGAQITALYVAPPVANYAVADPSVVWEPITDEVRIQRLETAFHAHHGDPRVKSMPFVVAFGGPAEEIAQYAQANGFELIVMASHGRTGVNRLLVGSVAERVVRLAHCPVLVLRH